MDIVKIDTCGEAGVIEEIIRVYQAAFSGPPWNETWPRERVIEDFRREMAMPQPLCLAAKTDERIIGFVWGYQVSAGTELDNKLEAPDLHQQVEGDFFYLDECAVDPGWQTRGVGTALLEAVFRERKGERILLRTMNNSQMSRLTEKLGGRIIQHISNGRVMMLIG